MQMQVEAERKKRAAILESEGMREADINIAEGKRQARILASGNYKKKLLNPFFSWLFLHLAGRKFDNSSGNKFSWLDSLVPLKTPKKYWARMDPLFYVLAYLHKDIVGNNLQNN